MILLITKLLYSAVNKNKGVSEKYINVNTQRIGLPKEPDGQNWVLLVTIK
tara:strand:+ start:375 stop:524 length:150 start_codon:yes stop_codon:yes gene_type:complete